MSARRTRVSCLTLLIPRKGFLKLLWRSSERDGVSVSIASDETLASPLETPQKEDAIAQASPAVNAVLEGKEKRISMMLALPAEIHGMIRHHLRPRDILSLMLTCKMLEALHKEYYQANVTLRTSLALSKLVEEAEFAMPVVSRSRSILGSKALEEYQQALTRLNRVKTLTIKACTSRSDLHEECRSKMLTLMDNPRKEGFLPDVFARAMPFLPYLESLYVHEYQWWFTQKSADQLKIMTPRLKKLHLFHLHTDLLAMISVVDNLPLLEELQVGDLLAMGGVDAVDHFVARDLAASITKHPSLKAFGSLHYGKAPRYNLESILVDELARLSSQVPESEEASICNKLESLLIQNSNFFIHSLGHYLCSPASVNLKHIAIKYDYISSDDTKDDMTWEEVLEENAKREDHPCFFNANTDLHLECGPIFFFTNILSMIQHRISKITVWCPIEDDSFLFALLDHHMPCLKQVVILGTQDREAEKTLKHCLKYYKTNVVVFETRLHEEFYEDHDMKPRWMVEEETALGKACWGLPSLIRHEMMAAI